MKNVNIGCLKTGTQQSLDRRLASFASTIVPTTRSVG
jgi:hypothetical protein